ncbi:MAG: hypothetical protein ABIQ75_01020 [Flavobacteriales bacterium]
MRKRTILFVVLLIAALGAYFGYRMYSAEVPNAVGQAPDFAVDAKTLYDAFVMDERLAGERYNDKVVEVTGTVRDVIKGPDGRVSILLETGDALGAVVCEFPDGETVEAALNSTVSLKGYCAGFNMDVLLQRSAWSR